MHQNIGIFPSFSFSCVWGLLCFLYIGCRGYILVAEMVRFKPIILSTARVENAWSFTSKAHIFMAYFYVQE